MIYLNGKPVSVGVLQGNGQGGGGGQPHLQTKTVSPTISQQVVQPDSGYDGLSRVTVNAVTAAIDNNIVASNIKSGVSILGVTGSLPTISVTINQDDSIDLTIS